MAHLLAAMHRNLWHMKHEAIALLLLIKVTTAQQGDRCVHNSDCPDYSSCTRSFCECRYGGPIYEGGKLVKCTSFATAHPAVIPSVVAVLLILLIAGGIGLWYYLRRKKRLERKRASTAYIVHTPTKGAEIHGVRETSSSNKNKKYRSVPHDPPSHM